MFIILDAIHFNGIELNAGSQADLIELTGIGKRKLQSENYILYMNEWKAVSKKSK